ncbi:MAG: FapA family protein [Lentisphaeraceae bacterium]|nr:FapA family protein [Lentisphaeraceae bacterium]
MSTVKKYSVKFIDNKTHDRLKSFMDHSEKTHISAYLESGKNQTLATVTFERTDEELIAIKEMNQSAPENVFENFFKKIFTVNEGIILKVLDEKTCQYISTEPGLLHITPTSISHLGVSPIIQEDIGTVTGPITYSGNVTCANHVLNGGQLTIDGDLTVMKKVEDHVKITCKGKLHIEWGASGQHSFLYSQQDCHIGYLEKSVLVCDANVEINAHTFIAKVFCRGDLKVHGNGVSSKTRGAVVGGVLNGLNSIQLKSVGAEGCTTKLIAGIDLRIQKQVNEANNLHAEMERAILISQQEIETFLSAAGKPENLGKMNAGAKDKVRNKLLALKKEQKALMVLEGKINKLKNMLVSKDLKNTFISFNDFMDPVVHLQISESEEIYKERIPGMSRFKHVDGKIKRVL